MRVRLDTLEDFIIDNRIALAMGRHALLLTNRKKCMIRVPIGPNMHQYVDYRPTAVWSQGGPLIELEQVSLVHIPTDDATQVWKATCMSKDKKEMLACFAETPLKAAMLVIATRYEPEYSSIPGEKLINQMHQDYDDCAT